MYLTDVFFHNHRPDLWPEQVPLLNALIDQWRYNGQLIGREIPLFLAEQEAQSGFAIRLICPEQSALLPENHNANVEKALAALEKCGLIFDSFQIVAEDLNSDETNTAEIPWQLLYTTHLQSCSPLHNGDNLAPIPLYKSFKNQPHLAMDLIKWQENWQACDQLQMNGSALEAQALAEIAETHSHLFKHGYALRAEIEQHTQIPTYYYLYRVGGDSLASELARHCPLCHGDWRQPEPILGLFHFKCDSCRVISNLSWNWQ